MVNKIINYLLLVVIGGLGLVCLNQSCKREKYKTLAEDYRIKYDNCIHAPIQIDTIHDTIRLPGGIVIKPIPVKVIVYDTIYVNLKESWYDSTYAGNGWRFRWKAYTIGSLGELTFSDFVIPKEIITYTKTIDTCLIKPPEIKQISHLWAYIKPGMIIYPFQVTNATVGLQYTRKDKWGIGIGAGYDWNIHYPVAEAQFLISLK